MQSEKTKVDKKTTNPLERRFKLEIFSEDVDQATEQRLQKMSKTLKLPGFRPGKVPLSVVKKNYGSEAHVNAINDAINDAYMNHIAKEKLIPAGPPTIEPVNDSVDGKETKKLEFEAVIEVMPTIDLPDRSILQVKKSKCIIDQVDVTRTIESLQKQKVKFKTVAREAKPDDQVTVDFSGTVNGDSFKGGDAKDLKYILGSGQMLKNFDDIVLSMKKGESKKEVVVFPSDYPAKDIAGKSVDFSVTLKSLEEPEYPALDDEFAKLFGIIDGGIEKLRTEVEKNLIREAERRCRIRTHNSALDALVQGVTFDLPKVMIESESKKLAENTNAEMRQKGISDKKTVLPPELFKDRATRRVKLGLLVNEVIAKEKLAPTDKQILEIVEEMSGVYEDPETFRKWFMEDSKRKSQAEAVALERNVADWIMSEAIIEEINVNAADLLSDSSEGKEIGEKADE